MDAKDIKELLRFVRDAGFSEFEIEQDGLKLRVVRERAADPKTAVAPGPVAPAFVAPAAPAVIAVAESAAAPAPAVASAPPAPAPLPENVFEQTAPMVGTFYRAARPGAPPFVSVGDRVAPGQVVCIIEAMKLMNEIEAEVAGTVLEVLPQNAQPVEYGEVLFRIRKE